MNQREEGRSRGQGDLKEHRIYTFIKKRGVVETAGKLNL